MEPAAGQDKRARDDLFAISYVSELDQTHSHVVILYDACSFYIIEGLYFFRTFFLSFKFQFNVVMVLVRSHAVF